MIDHTKLWTDLGLDLELHDKIMAATEKKFEAQILSQAGRPAAMAYFDGVIHGAHGDRVAEIVERRRHGDKFIGTFCIYVPEEIVLALGAIPVALCGGTPLSIPYAEQTFPRNICPLVKSTLGLAFSNTCPFGPIEDLAVGETTCDAKKKTWDILAKGGGFHVLEVPQKKGELDRDLWLDEVGRFKLRLEETTGRRLDAARLTDAVRLMNRKRTALARLHDFRKRVPAPISGRDALVATQGALLDDPKRYCDHLDWLNAELEDRARRGFGAAPAPGKRLMVSGCPMVLGNWKLHFILESAGAIVVCDETCIGTRYFEHNVVEVPGDLDAQMAAIAERYMKIDCSCFSPNEDRIAHIVELARACRADGVIQYVLHACHGYNIEAIAVAAALDEAGIPSLKVETDYSDEDSGPLGLRVEAFLESLEPHARI